MDIDFNKSATSEEQMDMMLMMQMDKLSHELSGGFADIHEFPMMDFITNNINSSGGILPQDVDHNSSHAAFLNLPATVSFTGSPQLPHHQEDPSGIIPFLSNSNSNSNNSGNEMATESHKRNINSVAAMREMIFRIAAMQPIHIDPESVKPPKRRNVKISKDPQSVAARHRRERISERIRILQRLVPGGTKMDTASMLDEAIHYVKFLKNQVQSLEKAAANRPTATGGIIGFPVPMSSGTYLPQMAMKGYHHHHHHSQAAQNVQHFADA